MTDQILIINASVSGFLGSIIPFLVPSLFRVLEKILNRALESQERRLVITILSVCIALVVILTRPEVHIDKEGIKDLFVLFITSFGSVKGMIQTVYELIIKNFDSLERKFS